MTWRSRDVRATLEKKGFTRSDTDHAQFRLMIGDKFTGVKTMVSHGREDIARGRTLFQSIKRQLKLDTNNELADFLDCPMTKERYVELLRERGHIQD